jgi:mannose-6-phosphate isomerase-like protein (cupin superfamily)
MAEVFDALTGPEGSSWPHAAHPLDERSVCDSRSRDHRQLYEDQAAVPNGFGHREEIYVILQGSGMIKLDDELIEVRPNDVIRVSPKVARAFEAGPGGLEVLATGPHREDDGEPVDDSWVK